MAILILPSQSLVLNAYAVLIGSTPGNASFKDHQAFIATNGVTAYKAALEGYASSVSTNAQLATALLTNLGLGNSFTQAQAEAFLTANAGNRVGAMTDLAAQLYGYSGTDVKLLASKAAYVTAVEGSFNFSNNIANVNGQALTPNVVDGQTYALTVGLDTLVGSAFNDTFTARTLNNVNTLNDGDKIDGGAGNDTVYVDFAVTGLAITPVLKNIETVVIRAQGLAADATNGNNTSSGNFVGLVQIDAQRSLAVDVADHVTADLGVTRWESNNSRSDVVIEDVRIGNTQKTKDVTIAMVETDPGNVDFAVYFDQQSLRNTGSGTSSLVIQVMDTGAAATPATADKPLLNNPYDTFNIGVISGGNTTLASIKLNPTPTSTVAANADTYPQLLAAFQAALLLAGSTATAAFGADFTVTDPLSNKAVTGKSIVLTAGAGITFSDKVPNSGWVNTTGAAVPNSSNIYTTFSSGATTVTELVTSTVFLDDVGRSNMGGDLVIGGMSTGDTSSYAIYRGVERFEITVGDNSKLQTINSTNNALREVTIVSGATSRTPATADAYTTTVTNEGDLTVNGDANNIPNGGINNNVGVASSGGNNNLPGVENNSPLGIHHGPGAAGFTDVRLIDASAFKGKLAFTAAITGDSIDKYITSVDTAANPAADVAAPGNVNFNVKGANFIYTGGNDNDTMVVTIDTAAVSSRSTVVSGQSDFTFNISGGEGNDVITTTIIGSGLAGGAQAWYTNQKLNANITINGGDGNDTIRTPGAGDKIINGDAGDDTIYTDNTGALTSTANATGFAGTAAVAYTNAAAAELAAAQAAFVLSNTTGFVTVAATGSKVTTAGAAAALDTLNLITPVNFSTVAPGAAPFYATIQTGIDNAVTAGGLTFAQAIALAAAYQSETTLGVVTPQATLAPQAITHGTPHAAGQIILADFTNGNSLLATFITAAKAAAATATAADTNKVTNSALLSPLLGGTQLAVANATDAQNRVFDGVVSAGTQTTVTNLAALQASLVVSATDAQVVTALQTAVDNGAITGAQATTLFTPFNGGVLPGSASQAEVDTANLTLLPLINNAANANTLATTALATAVTNNTNAVNAVAQAVAANPSGFTPLAVDVSPVANDEAGSLQTATAAKTALDTLNNFNTTTLTPATTKVADLAVLKAAIVGAAVVAGATSELQVSILTSNAVAKGTITAGDKVNIDTAANAGAPAVGGFVDLTEKFNVDLVITALQVTADIVAADATNQSANLLTISNATATAATISLAAANSGPNSLLVAAPKAVFVFDTSNQTSTYNPLTQDDRNLADLKSDINNSNNFFNSTVKVTYKGLDASVIVAGTGFKTSDLEINQAIKAAINLDPILSKLIVAADGPANTLVVTSLIDGTHTTANLAVTVTMPTTLTAADLAGAITAYGLAAGTTDVALLATLTTAKAAFDTKGDYVTQFAESGAAGGNVVLTGANSTSSSDNKVTPGTGNDVIVLGTTVGTDALTSSNEVVIYAGLFGNDTIVNFAASGLGIDQLNFSALNGSAANFGSLSADKSIVVGAATAVAATVLTAAQIAALFTDSATAINHVYVAVDSNNIGSIWQVADAAGTAAGNVTATLVGSIDLADTSWGAMTAANFI